MIMYYSFYLNEKLLLDEWQYYDECNWLLTNLLCKDDRKNVEEKLDFYFSNRHVRDDSQWRYLDENDKYFKEAYEDYKYKRDMYYEHLEYGEDNDVIAFVPFQRNSIFEAYEQNINKQDSNKEAVFIKKMIRNSKINSKLREINEVILYQSDLDAITKAKQDNKLTEFQLQVLFGLILFSRLHDVEWCRVGTEFKWKSFKACFDKTIKATDLQAILDTGLFKQVVTNKAAARKKLGTQAEYLNIKDEIDYKYLGFANKDKVAFIYKTTKENNRLNLTEVFKEVIPNYKVKYCCECGCEFTPASNRQKMCTDCKAKVIKEQARVRKQRQRQKGR